MRRRYRSPLLKRFLNAIPGHRFGVYRLLPIFAIAGAALEFTMIHWRVGEVNFCKDHIHIRIP